MSKAKLFGSSILSLIALLGQGAAQAAPTVVVLPNASFEQDGTGVASPKGWTSSGSTNADFTEAGGHTGGFRLSHYSAQDYSVDTRQTVSGLKTGWYTLRGWVKRSPGANNSYLQLSCGSRTEKVFLPVSWADQWLQVVVSTYVERKSCTITLHTDGTGGEWSNFDDIELVPGAAQLSVLGADVSSLTKSEDLGGEYFDDFSRPKHCSADESALDILQNHGASHIRVRVWVNPADGYHDVAEAKQMARRAKAAGLKVLADLHFSDTWADPGHQAKPAAWVSYSVPQLRDAVYAHTYEVCRAMTVQGKGPDMIQIGNR